MRIKHFVALLSLSASVVSPVHATEAPAREQQDPDKAVAVAEVESVSVVGAPENISAGKTRSEVVDALLVSIKDGSYVAPSEIYPVMITGAVQR